MASRKKRRRRKSKVIQNALKFEIYGLLIIAVSLIAMTRYGWIGSIISGIFRFFAGTWDFVFPVTGMAIAVYIMAKREWPSVLSGRWTGYLLVIFAILIWNHLSFYQLITADSQQDQNVMQVTWDHFFQEREQLAQGEASTTDIGGGMIGALGLVVFSYLFGSVGTRIMVFFMTLIGVILLFRISFVTLFKKVKDQTVHIFQKGNRKVNESLELLSEKRERRRQEDDFQDEADDDMVIQTDEPMETVTEESPVIHDFADSLHQQQYQNETNKEKATITIRPNHPKNEDVIEPDETIEDGFQKEIHHDRGMSDYTLPSLDLLEKMTNHQPGQMSYKDIQQNARKLERTLESFGVKAKVTRIHRGPAVTRYEVQPAVGVKVSRIVNLTDDIALALAAKDIRMEAPIPGKPAIGIEVPNNEVAMVSLREVLESSAFREAESKLSVALGRDISGEPIVANLAKMPHLLVAGATGSGKSVCINSIVTSILYKAKPQEVKLMMIDPKMVELNVYNGVPHLLAPVVTNPRRAAVALKKVLAEMERRYELFAKAGTRDIDRYNQMMAAEAGDSEKELSPALPYIVVIVDELADLMMVAPADVEDAICRLAQMARAAGIHLIIATQRPSVDVITGVIKANIPSRIAFGVSSQADSRTILDMGGAEKLLGRGDMLFHPVGANKPVRIQGTFVSDSEVEKIVEFVKGQQEAHYQEDMIPDEQEDSADETEVEDELFDRAVQTVVEAQTASVSMLQRRFRIGYTRAARLIDAMEARGIVGPYEGSKPREVLVPRNDSQISS
ncbi:MAG: DNA translocase FtsK [Bacillaceae bacterium]|nr:DNA translocase FtsK [Bacillaceae bacterium]